MPPSLIGGARVTYDRAMRDVHFPDEDRALAVARERLKFDELFTLELGVAFRKHRVEADQHGVAHAGGEELTRRLLTTIPFEPTGAQRRAMDEIGQAMSRPRPMNVLLQGDVGAGKTLVALHATLIAIASGHQAAIMAPTEVLASQHYRAVSELCRGGRTLPGALRAGRPSAEAGFAALSACPLDCPSQRRRSSRTFALLTAA